MTAMPRSMKPALLFVDSRCEALSNLERHKQPLELDERKCWLKEAISRVDFWCRLCREQIALDGHFIFEQTTGARRCPIEAARNIIANPAVTPALGGTNGSSRSELTSHRNRRTTTGDGIRQKQMGADMRSKAAPCVIWWKWTGQDSETRPKEDG